MSESLPPLFTSDSHVCLAFSKPNFQGKVCAYHGRGSIFVGVWNNADEKARKMHIGSMVLNRDESGDRRMFLGSQPDKGAFRQSGYVFAGQKQYVAIDDMSEWLETQNCMESLGMGDDDQVFVEFLQKNDDPPTSVSKKDAEHTSMRGSAVKSALGAAQEEDEDVLDDAAFHKYKPDSKGRDATFAAKHADGDVAPDDAARGIGPHHHHDAGEGGAQKKSLFISSLTKDLEEVSHNGSTKWFTNTVFLFIVVILIFLYLCYWLYSNINWLKAAVTQGQLDIRNLQQQVSGM